MNLYLCRYLAETQSLNAVAVVREVSGEKATQAFIDGLKAYGYNPADEDCETILLVNDGSPEVISLAIDGVTNG